MPSPDSAPGAPAPSERLSLTFIGIVVTEIAVILALYFVGTYFSA